MAGAGRRAARRADDGREGPPGHARPPDVTSAIAPCMSYATGQATAPSAECCGGVKILSGKASNAADRKAACRCLKNLAANFKGISMGNAASIPASAARPSPSPSAPASTAASFTKLSVSIITQAG
uniref:Non-specific lipid-transfer protein 3 n=1 Tax=Aegilops tauschii TaxID=37682 RepID=M8CAY5_AEGTA